MNSVIRRLPRRVRAAAGLVLVLSAVVASTQTKIPEWCRALPRSEYKSLERVPVKDSWFEVYKIAHGVFAIYKPHQSEETSATSSPDKNVRCFSTPGWASAI